VTSPVLASTFVTAPSTFSAGGFFAAATYDGSVKSFNDDGGVPEAGLRLAIDEAKKAANINRDIAINDVADLTVLREAQREMSIK
jgi:hypothetical protein